MKKVLQILLGMVVIVALMALAIRTSRKDTPAHFDALHAGMSKQEVVNLMGLPPASGAIGGPADSHAPTWNYQSGIVNFAGDKVDKLTPRTP